ncbi:MAG TPA: flagellar biosynthetic protein FliO [Terriglobales bacterium]|nr:flagellar biosynthetic protein FliO [Terriglobales bacterium]
MNNLLTILVSTNLVAQTEKVPDVGTGSLIIRLFLSLVLIIGLIYLSLFLLKKSSLGIRKNRTGELIQVLERCYVSPKKGIFIVKIGSKVLALGVTEAHINLLSEINLNSDTKTDSEDKIVSEKEIQSSLLKKIKGKLNL